MQLKDFARELPEEVRVEFEPGLPPVVWCGNGRKPYANRVCLHALLYVLTSGISWDFLPPGFPSQKTIKRRLKVWLELDCFLTVWRRLAQRYQALQGINWDQILLDGAKRPAKEGGSRRAAIP